MDREMVGYHAYNSQEKEMSETTCVSHRRRHVLQERQVDQENGGAQLAVFE